MFLLYTSCVHVLRPSVLLYEIGLLIIFYLFYFIFYVYILQCTKLFMTSNSRSNFSTTRLDLSWPCEIMAKFQVHLLHLLRYPIHNCNCLARVSGSKGNVFAPKRWGDTLDSKFAALNSHSSFSYPISF